MSQYSMIEPFMTYLNRIHTQFCGYLDGNPVLCRMMGLHFSGGNIPDYSDTHFQQYYLLRYAYAYAYEYKKMYTALADSAKTLPLVLNSSGQVTVTSIGCGAMLDYWALARFLELRGVPQVSIAYRGIDRVDWNADNRIKARIQDSVQFCQEDAVGFLAREPALDSNLYFFPKSISEFSEPDFETLRTLFAQKPVSHNLFHVLISIRENKVCEEKDYARAQLLKNAILSNGFELSGTDTLWKAENLYENTDAKIRDMDDDFPLPSNIIDTVTTLYSRCEFYPGEDGGGCMQFDDAEACRKNLSWYPILNVKYVRYIIMTFKRKTE